MKLSVLILIPETTASDAATSLVMKGLVVKNSFTLVPPTIYGVVEVQSAGVCYRPDVSTQLTFASRQDVIRGWTTDDANRVSIQGDCYTVDGGTCAVSPVGSPLPVCDANNTATPDANVFNELNIYSSLTKLADGPDGPTETAVEAMLRDELGPSNITISCSSILTMTNDTTTSVESIGALLGWTVYLSFWQIIHQCASPISVDLTPFTDALTTLLQTNTSTHESVCLHNAISSAIAYLDVSVDFESAPMDPSVCYPQPAAFNLTDLQSFTLLADNLLTFPPITTPVFLGSDFLAPRPDSSTCAPFRGNAAPCSDQDVWSCDSVGGCFSDWGNGVCADTPPGFYSPGGTLGGENSCNAIPSDQFFVGIAWTDPVCPSKCSDIAFHIVNGVCVEMKDFGYFNGVCDGDSGVYACLLNDAEMRPLVQFPVKGSCDGAVLLTSAAASQANTTAPNEPSVSTWIRTDTNYTADDVAIAGVIGVWSVGMMRKSASTFAIYLAITGVGETETDAMPHWMSSEWHHLSVIIVSLSPVIRIDTVERHHSPNLQTSRVITGHYPAYYGPLSSSGSKRYPKMELFDVHVNFHSSDGRGGYQNPQSCPGDWIRPEPCKFGSALSGACNGRPIRFPTTTTTTTTTTTATTTTTTTTTTTPTSTTTSTTTISTPTTATSTTETTTSPTTTTTTFTTTSTTTSTSSTTTATTSSTTELSTATTTTDAPTVITSTTTAENATTTTDTTGEAISTVAVVYTSEATSDPMTGTSTTTAASSTTEATTTTGVPTTTSDTTISITSDSGTSTTTADPPTTETANIDAATTWEITTTVSTVTTPTTDTTVPTDPPTMTAESTTDATADAETTTTTTSSTSTTSETPTTTTNSTTPIVEVVTTTADADSSSPTVISSLPTSTVTSTSSEAETNTTDPGSSTTGVATTPISNSQSSGVLDPHSIGVTTYTTITTAALDTTASTTGSTTLSFNSPEPTTKTRTSSSLSQPSEHTQAVTMTQDLSTETSSSPTDVPVGDEGRDIGGDAVSTQAIVISVAVAGAAAGFICIFGFLRYVRRRRTTRRIANAMLD